MTRVGKGWRGLTRVDKGWQGLARLTRVGRGWQGLTEVDRGWQRTFVHLGLVVAQRRVRRLFRVLGRRQVPAQQPYQIVAVCVILLGVEERA